MWKLCSYIILHRDAQTAKWSNIKQNTLLRGKGGGAFKIQSTNKCVQYVSSTAAQESTCKCSFVFISVHTLMCKNPQPFFSPLSHLADLLNLVGSRGLTPTIWEINDSPQLWGSNPTIQDQPGQQHRHRRTGKTLLLQNKTKIWPKRKGKVLVDELYGV